MSQPAPTEDSTGQQHLATAHGCSSAFPTPTAHDHSSTLPACGHPSASPVPSASSVYGTPSLAEEPQLDEPEPTIQYNSSVKPFCSQHAIDEQKKCLPQLIIRLHRIDEDVPQFTSTDNLSKKNKTLVKRRQSDQVMETEYDEEWNIQVKQELPDYDQERSNWGIDDVKIEPSFEVDTGTTPGGHRVVVPGMTSGGHCVQDDGDETDSDPRPSHQMMLPDMGSSNDSDADGTPRVSCADQVKLDENMNVVGDFNIEMKPSLEDAKTPSLEDAKTPSLEDAKTSSLEDVMTPPQCSMCHQLPTQFNREASRNYYYNSKSCTCVICDEHVCGRCFLDKHLLSHTNVDLPIAGRKQPYKCTVCDYVLTTKSSLHTHYNVHKRKGQRLFQCNVCNGKFASKGTLLTHLRLHSKDLPHQCDICDKGFAFSGHLEAHMRMHSGERPFQCKICLKRFVQKASLHVHSRLHGDELPYRCKICDKGFAVRGNLTKHFRQHSGERPYVCSVCNKSYTTKNCLTLHAKLHSGERPYQCHHCDKRFPIKNYLEKHLLIHDSNREQPFHCDVCGNRFCTKYQLASHSRVHTGEKPFKCDLCGKRSGTKSHLKEHYRIHSEERPFQCSVCFRKFTHKSSLKVHSALHRKDS